MKDNLLFMIKPLRIIRASRPFYGDIGAFISADNFPLPAGAKPVRDETAADADLR